MDADDGSYDSQIVAGPSLDPLDAAWRGLERRAAGSLFLSWPRDAARAIWHGQGDGTP